MCVCVCACVCVCVSVCVCVCVCVCHRHTKIQIYRLDFWSLFPYLMTSLKTKQKECKNFFFPTSTLLIIE